jgi:hypothetical protein
MLLSKSFSLAPRKLFLAFLISGLGVVSRAQDIALHSVLVLTAGNPTSALEARRRRYVFVSVTNVGAPNFSGPDSAAGARKEVVSGIQIFKQTDFFGLYDRSIRKSSTMISKHLARIQRCVC